MASFARSRRSMRLAVTALAAASSAAILSVSCACRLASSPHRFVRSTYLRCSCRACSIGSMLKRYAVDGGYPLRHEPPHDALRKPRPHCPGLPSAASASQSSSMWRVKRICRPTRPPSWPTLITRAWRSRREHDGFYAAFRVERAEAKEQAKRESERATGDRRAPSAPSENGTGSRVFATCNPLRVSTA
jgi:hypothetical protein